MNLKFQRSLANTVVTALIYCCGLSISGTQAEDDVIIIEGTRIRGNQESPTILYLVPWQAPEVIALDAPAASLAIERPLKPLERSEFKRLISYHQHFKRASDKALMVDRTNVDSADGMQP